MAGFTAASVSALDYDFTAVVLPPGAEPILIPVGVVAEPTDVALNGFYAAMSDLRAAVTSETADPTEDQFAKIRTLVTEFCAGSPDAPTIAALPPRYLQAFTAWLLKELGGGDPKD